MKSLTFAVLVIGLLAGLKTFGKEYGAIEIEGEVGAGEGDNVFLAGCEPDSQFVLKQYSCHLLKENFKVNVAASVPAGIYTVSFAGYLHGVIVSANQKTVVKLLKLEVPQGQLPMRFHVFMDLSDKDQLLLWMTNAWANSEGKAWDDSACRLGYTDICHAVHTSPKAMEGVISKSDNEANDYEISYKQDGSGTLWTNHGRVWVTDFADAGGFASLLPGTYGIEYQYSDGTVADTKYGIVLK